MNPVFNKLKYKDQRSIHIINAPPGFKSTLADMRNTTIIINTLISQKEIEFFLGFVTTQKEVDDLTAKVVKLLKEDGLFWFAYPKGTSKKYSCEFNRDTGWNELGKHGFEGVRMVAIDEDWSALRFRKAEMIKTMTRSFAMSETGKKKATAGKRK